MPDISMCTSHTCSLKESCYRHKAKPSMWQSCADFSQDENGNCDYYWNIN